jgi:hypothetical protein
VTITVDPVPVATATPASQSICSGQTTNIALSSNIVGTTFAWTVVETDVTGASNGSGNSIAQTLTATTTLAGMAVYTITPTANGCVGNPITVAVIVNPIPDVTATPPSQSIDNGESTNIALTSVVPGTTFSWTVVQVDVTGASDGSGSTIAQTLMTTTFNSGTATYTITPTFNGCTGTPIVVVVTVNTGIPVGPTDFAGVVAKNKFLTQTEIINILTWTPSIDPTVTGYHVYQDGQLIATVPASGPYEVVLHNRRSGQVYTYALTAFDENGESLPLVITVP